MNNIIISPRSLWIPTDLNKSLAHNFLPQACFWEIWPKTIYQHKLLLPPNLCPELYLPSVAYWWMCMFGSENPNGVGFHSFCFSKPVLSWSTKDFHIAKSRANFGSQLIGRSLPSPWNTFFPCYDKSLDSCSANTHSPHPSTVGWICFPLPSDVGFGYVTHSSQWNIGQPDVSRGLKHASITWAEAHKSCGFWTASCTPVDLLQVAADSSIWVPEITHMGQTI